MYIIILFYSNSHQQISVIIWFSIFGSAGVTRISDSDTDEDRVCSVLMSAFNDSNDISIVWISVKSEKIIKDFNNDNI